MKYYAETEGYVFYKFDTDIQVHAKQYTVYKILKPELFNEEEPMYEQENEGIVEYETTLYRDGWFGQFYDIDWNIEEWDCEFSNGTSCDEFEEIPPALSIDIEDYKDITDNKTPVFW